VVDYREHFWWPYVVQWVHALFSYKKKAQKAGIEHRELGKEFVTVDDVEIVLSGVVQRPPGLRKLYLESKPGAKTFAWTGPRFTVKMKDQEAESEYCFFMLLTDYKLITVNLS
jgi:hypothetical protein